jgi:hypothetical protein
VRLLVLPLLLLASLGCSNRQIYSAIQEGQRVDCQKYPDTRYEQCMEQLETPYDEYEAERDNAGVIKPQPSP